MCTSENAHSFCKFFALNEVSQVSGRCAPHLASLHPYKSPFVLIPGFLRRTQSAPLPHPLTLEVQKGSAVQVQRKSILSAALLMCPPPTWGNTDVKSATRSEMMCTVLSFKLGSGVQVSISPGSVLELEATIHLPPSSFGKWYSSAQIARKCT